MVPEIANYEVRRELIRARRTAGIARLDAFIGQVEFLPIETAAMRQAAAFWTEARHQGQPTVADPALDGDVILAAQAATLDRPDVIVATTTRNISLDSSQRNSGSISPVLQPESYPAEL